MAISFHKAIPAHAEEIEPNLLEADRLEILAMGFAPEWGIRNSIETSLEAVTIRWDGEIACITGCCRTIDLNERVYPWLVSTSLILEHRKLVLKYSREILDHWLQVYPHMTNYVDARHTRAIRWLKWLGASLDLEPQFGPYKRPFYKFTFGDPNVH